MCVVNLLYTLLVCYTSCGSLFGDCIEKTGLVVLCRAQTDCFFVCWSFRVLKCVMAPKSQSIRPPTVNTTATRRGEHVNKTLRTSVDETISKKIREKEKGPTALPNLPGAKPYVRLFAHLNEKVENGLTLSKRELGWLWHDWLWGSDPDGKLFEECGCLNTMHMRGLLLCRALLVEDNNTISEKKAQLEMLQNTTRENEEHTPNDTNTLTAVENDTVATDSHCWDLAIEDIIPETDDVHLYEKPISALSCREFRDTLEAMQLHTKKIVKQDGVERTRYALFRLFIRLGVLAGHAMTEDVMDDQYCVTNIPCDNPTVTLFILTCKALRTHVDMFFVLFRILEIASNATRVTVCSHDNGVAVMESGDCCRVGQCYVDCIEEMLKPFHIEASLDMFNVMQQLFFLAPAQRLVYKHNFSGMYNDISQVVYFHYPDYVRSPQMDVTEIGKYAMNSLPCIGCIVPQLRVLYDDENGMPLGNVPPSEWFWLVSLGTVYLWDGKQRKLLKSSGASVNCGRCCVCVCVYVVDKCFLKCQDFVLTCFLFVFAIHFRMYICGYVHG